MEIKKMQQEKHQYETAIKTLLNDFIRKTGVKITDLSFDSELTMEEYPSIERVFNVDLEVKL